MNNKKLIILFILTIFCIGIAITSVSANDNVSDAIGDGGVLKQTVADNSLVNEYDDLTDISNDETSNKLSSDSDNGVGHDYVVEKESDSENYQPRIIPQGYGYRQNIPQQINYSTDYEDSYGYYVSVVDEEGYNIPYLEVRLVDANTNEEEMVFAYQYDEDAYWCCVSAMGVGNHSCRIIVDDYYYNVKPIDFNLEVVKADSDLILKEAYVVMGDYVLIKAKVTDIWGYSICDEGKVKFTVNGKDYYRSIDENGVATLKVKMNKYGSFTYYASFLGGKNHNPSSTKKSKIYVFSTSKSSRTIYIKGYKVVVPLDKYKKLIYAKYTKKTFVYRFNTGKTIKQKISIYNINTGKKVTKIVKSKIYIIVAFDGSKQYTGSLPGNQYVVELTTSSQYRYGNIVCYKWLFGYKQSKEFSKLNYSKVRQKLIGL